mgnify:CR=1 FL=1
MRKKQLFGILALAMVMAGCENVPSASLPSSNPPSSSTSSSAPTSSSSFVGKEDGIVTLYSINDFHGKIAQDSQYNGILALQGAILQSEEYESSSLVLSSGDMWQGGYISGYDKGESTTRLMNEFPFVSMALGNHEFDWGVEQIQHNQEVADFPFLCANLVEQATDERPEWIEDHTVVEAEGHKIGIVGAIGAGLESDIKASALKGFEFTSDLSVLREAYDACVEEGAEVVVLSLHDDARSAYTDSIQDSGIPFAGIFGGHSHSFQNEDDEKMPYVQGGCDSEGYSANLVLKAMFETAKKYWPEKNYDETNLLAVHNTGGVRGEFPSSDGTIEITMADIQIVSPFDNEVVMLPQREVSGSALSGNYCYPDRYSLSGKTVDIVAIDYLLSDYPGNLFYSEGMLPLKGEGEESYIIYDVVADYIKENSTPDSPLDAADF